MSPPLTPHPAPARALGSAARVAPGPQSCLYEGTVIHRRYEKVRHDLTRRLFMFHLRLDELPGCLDYGRLCSAERAALARFERRRHLGDPDEPLDETIRKLVARHAGERPQGPVTILTQLSYLGLGFNPISVYYCYDASGSRLTHLVAEVSNTPWLEMHPYVFAVRDDSPHRRSIHLTNEKAFHVSPFLDMDYTYRWRVTAPGERLQLHIENWADERRAFTATYRARRRELSRAQIVKLFARHPLMSWQAVVGIYVEAAKLWWKGADFYGHPERDAPGDEAPEAGAPREQSRAAVPPGS